MTTLPSERSEPPSAAGSSTLRAAHLASLALLAELENSLQSGQKALLALDISAIEASTAQQVRLTREIHIHPSPRTSLSLSQNERGEGQRGEDHRFAELSSEPWLSPELHAAALRVLQLARVQAALLRRTQRLLTVLSNLRADPGEAYGPRLLQNRFAPWQNAPAVQP